MPTANLTKENLELLFREIKSAGFPLVGAVDIDLARENFQLHTERYEKWIHSGFHAEMGYLVRGLDRRKDPRLVLPGVKSVITVAIPYRRNPSLPLETEKGLTPRYARYLEGPDYHTYIPELLSPIFDKWATALSTKWKICVDTSAVLERSWAALTGLGWLGKNTLLINPKFGSYLFIGVIFLDRATGIPPAPIPNFCGHCTSCLDGCPTNAFPEPGTLDSNRCISYLTLEKRGEWDSLDPPITSPWVAGCDICQEVCPFNRKPSLLEDHWPKSEKDTSLLTDWNALKNENSEKYSNRVKHSALKRIKYPDMQRNIKNALKEIKDLEK